MTEIINFYNNFYNNNPFFYTAITILIGIFIGMAGQYYADKFTDKRRSMEKKYEQKKQIDLDFEYVCKNATSLIKEMEKDVKMYPYLKFVVLFVRANLGGSDQETLYYEAKNHENIRTQTQIILDKNFIQLIKYNEDETIGFYKFNETFIDLLKNLK